MILSHKHQTNMISKINCCRIATGTACTLLLSSTCMASVFSKNSSVPHIFSLFFLRVKVRKKIVNQILGYILSFCSQIRAHLGHYFAWAPKIIKFNQIVWLTLPPHIINKPWISRKNYDKDLNFITKNNRR